MKYQLLENSAILYFWNVLKYIHWTTLWIQLVLAVCRQPCLLAGKTGHRGLRCCLRGVHQAATGAQGRGCTASGHMRDLPRGSGSGVPTASVDVTLPGACVLGSDCRHSWWRR